MRRVLVASALAAATACGGGGGTDAAAVVQIANFSVTPATVNCIVGGSSVSSPDTVYLQVEMVNTTGADATVSSAGANGTVIRTSTNDFVGSTAIAFTTLPYNPQPALIRAKTGDVTVRVSLPTGALCGTNSMPANGFKDVQTSARISTNSGEYTSSVATIHVFFQPS